MDRAIVWLIIFAGGLPAASGADTPTTQPVSILRVSSFGATGDGIHDDQPAIQRAINFLGRHGRGKIVFEPAAVYRLGRAITLTNTQNIDIAGQQATLKPLNKVQAVTEQGGILYVTNVGNLTIRDLKLDGNRTNRRESPFPCRAQALSLGSCDNVEISRCEIKDVTADGILLWATNPKDPNSACKQVKIHSNLIQGVWRNGISVVHARQVEIADNRISDVAGGNPEAGVDVEPNGGEPAGITCQINITGNQFRNCGIGVCITSVAGVQDVSVYGNDIGGCGQGLQNALRGLVWRDNKIHDTRPTGAPIYCRDGGTLVER